MLERDQYRVTLGKSFHLPKPRFASVKTRAFIPALLLENTFCSAWVLSDVHHSQRTATQ
jgi:hypothetical protein